MLWSKGIKYYDHPFELESDFERAILEVSSLLFGQHRIYLPVKKKIGTGGKIKNIPDGYLIDLFSKKDPKLYVVENELARHDPLKHIAVQILEFSLSFQTSYFHVKSLIKEVLLSDTDALSKCQMYVTENGYDNLDVLLERIIYGKDRFSALVIIDDLAEELEEVLISRFRFPVEILTLQRYRNDHGDSLYRFEPFLSDLTDLDQTKDSKGNVIYIDPSDIDTIVVPARKEGFNEVFLGENRWYAIRIHSSMIPKIKYIAAYQVAPKHAITHMAPVDSIVKWRDTSKYVVNFSAHPHEIGPISLVPKGLIKAPMAPRYTSKAKLEVAKNLDEAF